MVTLPCLQAGWQEDCWERQLGDLVLAAVLIPVVFEPHGINHPGGRTCRHQMDIKTSDKRTGIESIIKKVRVLYDGREERKLWK